MDMTSFLVLGRAGVIAVAVLPLNPAIFAVDIELTARALAHDAAKFHRLGLHWGLHDADLPPLSFSSLWFHTLTIPVSKS